MATLQLTFNLRTSSSCKTVHLVGNWDGYKSQLPLSKESSKSGAWKGVFRFSGTLQQGQRYWYYYIIDGYSVSHDPAQPFTVEPTTQRKLNILDIPSGGSKPSLTVKTSSRDSSKRSSRRESALVAHGRSLSPSKIVSPRPQKPHEARRLANKRYSGRDIDQLTDKLSRATVSASSFSSDDESEEDSEIDSDASSDIPSLSSGSASPASSLVSPISPSGSPCSCDRFGTTKSGQRVRLDCGGSRCGSSDSGSSDSEADYYRTKLVSRRGAEKRHGIAVRSSRR